MTPFQGALLRDKPDGHSRELPRDPTSLSLVDEEGETQMQVTCPASQSWLVEEGVLEPK